MHVQHAPVEEQCCKKNNHTKFLVARSILKKLYMVKISNEVSVVVKINIYITVEGMYKIVGCRPCLKNHIMNKICLKKN